MVGLFVGIRVGSLVVGVGGKVLVGGRDGALVGDMVGNFVGAQVGVVVGALVGFIISKSPYTLQPNCVTHCLHIPVKQQSEFMQAI